MRSSIRGKIADSLMAQIVMVAGKQGLAPFEWIVKILETAVAAEMEWEMRRPPKT